MREENENMDDVVSIKSSSASEESGEEKTKEIENQLKESSADAKLAAAAMGLELDSLQSQDSEEGLSFIFVLADDRTFGEMYAILEDLLKEEQTADPAEREQLKSENSHITSELRSLLATEARDRGESKENRLLKLHNWLKVAEDEEAENNGEERYREREYDQTGSPFPRTEEYGDEEPQGCGQDGSNTSTSVANVSIINSATARLGANQK